MTPPGWKPARPEFVEETPRRTTPVDPDEVTPSNALEISRELQEEIAADPLPVKKVIKGKSGPARGTKTTDKSGDLEN